MSFTDRLNAAAEVGRIGSVLLVMGIGALVAACGLVELLRRLAGVIW